MSVVLLVFNDSLGEPLEAELRAGGDDVRSVRVRRRDPDVSPDRLLERAAADVAAAEVVLLVTDDDILNLNLALALREGSTSLPLVVRFFNLEIGEHSARVLGGCRAISASAIAAPSFVAALLRSAVLTTFSIAGETYSLTVDADHPIASLEGLADGADDLRVIRGAGLSGGRNRMRTSRVAQFFDRRIRLFAIGIVVVLAVSTLVFAVGAGYGPLNGLYFTVTSVTTTGYGDLSLLHAAPWLRLYGIALLLIGAGSLALLFSLLAEKLVSSRLVPVLGQVRLRARDHVIVVGIGTVGLRIATQLTDIGVPVVIVDRGDGPPGHVTTARALGIPVFRGDPTGVDALRALSLDDARSVAIVSSDDGANIETALNVRLLRPEIRIVLRLHDAAMARRIEQPFSIHFSRSVSALAAPAFAAAVYGCEVLAGARLGDLPIFVVRIPATLAAGWSAERLESLGGVRVLARGAETALNWSPDHAAAGEAAGLVLCAVSGERMMPLLQRLSGVG